MPADAALALFLLEFAAAAFALDAHAQAGPILLRVRAAVGFEAGRRAELPPPSVARTVLTAAIAADGALAAGRGGARRNKRWSSSACLCR